MFYVNFKRKVNLFILKKFYVSINIILNRVKILKTIKNNISKMQKRFTKYINKKIIFQLKKRNKVYLLMKNLKTKKSSKKLNNIKIESFYIKNIKKSINYELNLSKNIRIHLIF